MIGAIAVVDYREFESWKRARFAVCAALDFAESLSRHEKHKRLSEDIDRLSVSILDTLSRGLEGDGDRAFVGKALDSVNRLDRALQKLSETRGIPGNTSQRLQQELRELRRLLQGPLQETEANEQSS